MALSVAWLNEQVRAGYLPVLLDRQICEDYRINSTGTTLGGESGRGKAYDHPQS
jgi:hypothetical protein